MKLFPLTKKFNHKIKALSSTEIINEKQILLLDLTLSIVIVFILVIYFKNQLFETGYHYASQNSTFAFIDNEDDKYIVFDQKDQRIYIKVEKINKQTKIIELNTKEYYIEESKYKYSIINNYNVKRQTTNTPSNLLDVICYIIK